MLSSVAYHDGDRLEELELMEEVSGILQLVQEVLRDESGTCARIYAASNWRRMDCRTDKNQLGAVAVT